MRWREDQRMILAKHLLHASRYPIARIASLVGYDDQMYFSRVFRKRVGASPSEFRRTSEASPAACVIADDAHDTEGAGVAGLPDNPMQRSV